MDSRRQFWMIEILKAHRVSVEHQNYAIGSADPAVRNAQMDARDRSSPKMGNDVVSRTLTSFQRVRHPHSILIQYSSMLWTPVASRSLRLPSLTCSKVSGIIRPSPFHIPRYRNYHNLKAAWISNPTRTTSHSSRFFAASHHNVVGYTGLGLVLSLSYLAMGQSINCERTLYFDCEE